MEQLNKETLLASIKPNMRLTKSFIKRIYGYGVTDASFPDKAIAALEAAGYSNARQYYTDWVNEYETACDAELKEVANWYKQECDKEWEEKQKGSGEQRTQREKKQTSRKWMEGLY